jgi:hypothetical protein
MTRRDPLPAFVQDMLRTPPRASEGVHNWLFRVARQLHAHLPAPEIVNLLENCVANCERFVPRSEIIAAVQNSLPCAWQPGSRSQPVHAAPKWPSVNQEQREAIIRDGGGLVDLWENSPVRFDDNATHTEALIDALFPGNPLLCCGLSNSKFDTRSREDWRGQLSALQLIVPSPMTARSGLTQDGKQSPHALSITGARWFLVIEQDHGAIDEQSAVLLHLASRAPLALAVHSGIKSIHGWFYCLGQPEERLRQVMRYCVSLGADRATWTRSQFVRMPDGLRDNGKRQVVYYFNPEVIR